MSTHFFYIFIIFLISKSSEYFSCIIVFIFVDFQIITAVTSIVNQMVIRIQSNFACVRIQKYADDSFYQKGAYVPNGDVCPFVFFLFAIIRGSN